jgi:hypothetical protein
MQAALRLAQAFDPVAGVASVAVGTRRPRAECPAYLGALKSALLRQRVPFADREYAELYRHAAADGQWLAVSLMTNAEREGDGAGRLWSLAACSTNSEERHLLKRHAVDESRHALAYLALLDLCFPDAVDPEFRGQLDVLSPRYSTEQECCAVPGSPYARTPGIDDYIQMNIAEIRTAIHHTLQRPALEARAPAENLPRVSKILDAILRDELNHVSYTAVLIEKKALDIVPGALDALFRRRLSDFSDITRGELGEFAFS